MRGRGLFIGIDIIQKDNKYPNAALANNIINKMRDKGILLSLDGPHHNVIKIKPPLPFNKNDCDFLIYELSKILSQL